MGSQRTQHGPRPSSRSRVPGLGLAVRNGPPAPIHQRPSNRHAQRRGRHEPPSPPLPFSPSRRPPQLGAQLRERYVAALGLLPAELPGPDPGPTIAARCGLAGRKGGGEEGAGEDARPARSGPARAAAAGPRRTPFQSGRTCAYARACSSLRIAPRLLSPFSRY